MGSTEWKYVSFWVLACFASAVKANRVCRYIDLHGLIPAINADSDRLSMVQNWDGFMTMAQQSYIRAVRYSYTVWYPGVSHLFHYSSVFCSNPCNDALNSKRH